MVRLLLGAVPLAYGAWLAWGEWAFRRDLPVAPAVAPINSASPVAQPLNHAAVVTVLGLQARDALARSAEPLQLRASFVASSGASSALLAGTREQRMYRVGDSLPGGSVLRRVEAGRVVLWRNGREEMLALERPARRSLAPLGSATPAGAAPSSHLRPALPDTGVNP
ncbi:type II secretion system protein N [Pseudomonas vanderleydeniana]|uniref:Protein XcpP n=1 Tax=Pseudomonas vanderleydeniana TaxID=2745495 RepID=A0A9E6TRW7_9PSED|nr:type II secretion system protein N [Pseudomonas vanderleydeniana]QXI28963.1 protein XcpP [Pseudomonas vanderleydeniana]